MFLPGATLQRTLELVHRDGDFFKVLLRLPKRKIVTVTLNTEYDVTCRRLSPTRAVGRSSSTSIAEVKNPGTASEHELPPGDDHGYPWRFDTFWRFEERDGGVYIEVEAVSLTRNAARAVRAVSRPMAAGTRREGSSEEANRVPALYRTAIHAEATIDGLPGEPKKCRQQKQTGSPNVDREIRASRHPPCHLRNINDLRTF